MARGDILIDRFFYSTRIGEEFMALRVKVQETSERPLFEQDNVCNLTLQTESSLGIKASMSSRARKSG